MKKNNIQTVIHYEPLHFSKVGKSIYKKNDLKKNYNISKRIVRFPSYVGIENHKIKRVINKTLEYFNIDK